MSVHAEKARWIHAREKRLNWQVRSFLNSLPAHARVDSTTEREKEANFYFHGIKYNERQHLRKLMVREPTENYEKRTDTWPCSLLNRAMHPIHEFKPSAISYKRLALFRVVVEFTHLLIEKEYYT